MPLIAENAPASRATTHPAHPTMSEIRASKFSPETIAAGVEAYERWQKSGDQSVENLVIEILTARKSAGP